MFTPQLSSCEQLCDAANWHRDECVLPASRVCMPEITALNGTGFVCKNKSIFGVEVDSCCHGDRALGDAPEYHYSRFIVLTPSVVLYPAYTDQCAHFGSVILKSSAHTKLFLFLFCFSETRIADFLRQEPYVVLLITEIGFFSCRH